MPDGADSGQVHVTITGESSVVVSWASPSRQVVNLTIEAYNASTDTVIGSRRDIVPTTTQYTLACGKLWATIPCRVPGNYSSPLLLHAHVEVQGSVNYRYRIGVVPHRWRYFRTPPAPGERGLRVAIVGDLGQTGFSASTCASIASAHASDRIDAGILLGDLAYSDTNASRWDSFGIQFDASGCSDVPWLVLPGNHEIDPDDLSGEPFLAYRHRWRTPEARPADVGHKFEVIDWDTYSFSGLRFDFGGSFYSVRLGPVHFVALNPYTAAEKGSAQARWLTETLLEVDRNVTPYLVVLVHAPWLHSASAHRCDDELVCAELRASAEEVLMSAGMNMVFSGHVHAYERSHPVDGVQHFVVGHGGNYEELYDAWVPSKLSAFRAGDHYGWGLLTLDGDVHSWEARRSSDGAVPAACGAPPPRAGGGPEPESLAVQVSLRAARGGGCVLAQGRGKAAAGPNPHFMSPVPLEWDDEGDMALQCTVMGQRALGLQEEAVAELAEMVPQAQARPGLEVRRRPLRPLGAFPAGCQLSLAFSEDPVIRLSVRPTTATGLSQSPDAWTFDPFVRVQVVARDPRDRAGGVAVVAEGRTETIPSCTGDPHWKESVAAAPLG
ncbi:unnamed protein product [Prorocentrum cordatum]|uniref:Purple acid phosphatase n=1 Tax=Prorocentrum cordatum TaxID=2364126 RepID=A0ABN9WPX5_9DINO|nr:unnamed protein product [Polarella glacialis]